MQLKYSFKKEWYHFTRTFRLGGILIAVFSFALADPLMYKALGALMQMAAEVDMDSLMATASAGVQVTSADYGYYDYSGMTDVFFDGGAVLGVALAEICSSAFLVIMLLLMSAAGGEQKKRATIIPSCSGLNTFNYLLPKFVIYPAFVLVVSFAGSAVSGVLCSVLFTQNVPSMGMMLFGALLCGIYMAFLTAVYLSVGLCTSRPGVTTVLMYIGVSVVKLILSSLDLTMYNPFTLSLLISGEMFAEGFSLADNAASIIVAVVLSAVIGVLMFLLALAVQRAKAINNQEDRPEF